MGERRYRLAKPSDFTEFEFHPQIIALRKRGYGRLTARYAAILLGVEEIGAALADAEVRTPDDDRDAVGEGRAIRAATRLHRRVSDLLVRHVEHEARRTVDHAAERGRP